MASQGLFRSTLQPEWTVLWQTRRLDIALDDEIDGSVEKLHRNLRLRQNPLLDHKDFFNCNQEDEEDIDLYVSALVLIHNRCGLDYEEEDSCLQCGHSCGHTNRLRERRIRDRLIFCLSDSSMLRRVLLEVFGKTVTLDRVHLIYKAHESPNDMGRVLSQDPSAHLLAAQQSSYKCQAHTSRPQRTTTEASSRC